MPFQINSTSPPDGAVPHGRGYRFELPEASGVNGQGEPVGAVGYPQARVTFERLTQVGWSWYVAFTGSNPSVALASLQVWNPFLAPPAWEVYDDAIMVRPTHDEISEGSYLGVEILFKKLEK